MASARSASLLRGPRAEPLVEGSEGQSLLEAKTVLAFWRSMEAAEL